MAGLGSGLIEGSLLASVACTLPAIVGILVLGSWC